MKKALLILFLGIVGCASGNCRSQKIEEKKNQAPAVAAAQGSAAMAKTSTPQERIKIYKYDGSLQCGQGKAVSVSEMAKELNGIQIYASENKSDGLMRIQVCGSPTGQANVYEIDRTQLAEAKKRGFKEWTFE